MKAKTFTIYNPIYRVYTFVRAGGTDADAAKWASKKLGCGVSGFEGIEAGVVPGPYGFEQCIWFRYKRPGATVVAHECLHAVAHTLHRAGVPPMSDAKSSEPHAYILGWLVGEITKRLK